MATFYAWAGTRKKIGLTKLGGPEGRRGCHRWFGQAVLQLWNWLMPSLFGLHAISFWQAVGLLALCWILFGQGFLNRPSHRTHWRRRMVERWEQMTPEEREKFRAGMRGGCRQFKAEATEPKA